MDLVSAFLGVIAIIGIIVVGGFVIFFLGDLVLSILDPNYSRFGHKKEEKLERKEETRQIEGPKEEIKEIEFKPFEEKKVKEEIKTPAVIEQGIGDDFFKDIKKEEVKELKPVGNLEDLRAEEEQFRANMLKAIEERKQKQAEKQETKNDIDFEKFFFDDDDIDVFQNDQEDILENQEEIEMPEQQNIEDLIIQGDSIEETKNTNTENIATEKKVQSEEDREKEEAMRDQYESTIAKLENEKLAMRQENERLAQEKLDDKEEIAKLVEEKINISKNLQDANAKEIKPKSALSIDEYEAQLEKLRERLVENEKDFRRIKKDFIPLRKVHNTLENDEKKLRRREAIVAKQKVELYGVNNIVDMDQEKAKKLTEDLDLLEGLKLSVKHCEEVMVSNKDRYPILEKAYSILSKDNKTLKDDIQELEEKVAKIKSDNE